MKQRTQKIFILLVALLALAGCATKTPNDLKKSPCACFEPGKRST